MNDDLKICINIMQDRLVNSSDNILLIFDTKNQLRQYKKENSKNNKPSNEILITIDDFLRPNSLVGLRFKRYWFMTDRDL